MIRFSRKKSELIRKVCAMSNLVNMGGNLS